MKICGGRSEPAAEEESAKAFDRTRDPAWAEAVDSWRWKSRDAETSSKSGQCQRCGHTITFVDATAVYSGFSTRESVDHPGRRYAACNCGVKHPDAPGDEIGCGANGLIDRG
jgi:hypothetical protein